MEISSELKQQIIAFLESESWYPNSLWVSDRMMKVYIRKSIRWLNKTQRKYLDIANIQVNPEYRYQGLCKSLLQFCLEQSPYPVRVENCFNPSLQNHLSKQKWVQVDNDYYAPV